MGLFLVAELIKKMDMLEKFAELNIFIRKTIGEAVHFLPLTWTEPELSAAENVAEVKHSDSHSVNYRLQALKDQLRKKSKALKIRAALEFAEFDHTVAAWNKTFRFVFKRQLIMTQNLVEQSELFEADSLFIC